MVAGHNMSVWRLRGQVVGDGPEVRLGSAVDIRFRVMPAGSNLEQLLARRTRSSTQVTKLEERCCFELLLKFGTL